MLAGAVASIKIIATNILSFELNFESPERGGGGGETVILDGS